MWQRCVQLGCCPAQAGDGALGQLRDALDAQHMALAAHHVPHACAQIARTWRINTSTSNLESCDIIPWGEDNRFSKNQNLLHKLAGAQDALLVGHRGENYLSRRQALKHLAADVDPAAPVLLHACMRTHVQDRKRLSLQRLARIEDQQMVSLTYM